MIDEFVFYSVLIGQIIVCVSQEVYTTVRCIKVSLFLYKRLVDIFMSIFFMLNVLSDNIVFIFTAFI